MTNQPVFCVRMGDGYALEVRVVVWERSDALKVATGALFRRGADWFVFVHPSDAITDEVRVRPR